MQSHLTLITLSIVLTVSACAAGQDQRLNNKSSQHANSRLAQGVTVSELSKSIWCVFQDKNNNHWFGSDGQGVYRYDGKTLTQYTTKDGLPGNRIRGIQQHKSGDIFINTAKGLCRYDGVRIAPLSVADGKNEWKLQPDDLWFSAGQDTGSVYRYDGKALYRLTFPSTKRGDEELQRFPRSKFPNANYSPYDVYTIYQDRQGAIWFGTAALGACRYDGKTFDWLYEDHLTNPPGGGSFGIRSIIEDKEGMFWFCNTRHRFIVSLNHHTGKETGLIQYQTEKGVDLASRAGAEAIYFGCIVMDYKQDLWMSTFGGGVWRNDGKVLTHYPVKDGNKDARMVSIYKDNGGDLWLGTNESGVYKFNGTSFEKFRP